MFSDLASSLRSLTRSPMDWALQEAHQMARRPLDAGGNVTSHSGMGGQDLVLPSDVTSAEVARGIEDWLRGSRFSVRKRSNRVTPSLKMTADEKVVVPAAVLLQLGDGFADHGKQVLERIVSEIRDHRMLDRLPVRPLLPGRR